MRITLTFLFKREYNTLYARAQTELINIVKRLSAKKLTLNINKTRCIVFASSKKIILVNDYLKSEKYIVFRYYTTRNFILETSHFCVVAKSSAQHRDII